MKKKEKKKAFKSMKKAAMDFLLEVPDENLSDLAGMQTTMNDFLSSMGLPHVSVVPGIKYDKDPETRSFEEIENELADISGIS